MHFFPYGSNVIAKEGLADTHSDRPQGSAPGPLISSPSGTLSVTVHPDGMRLALVLVACGTPCRPKGRTRPARGRPSGSELSGPLPRVGAPVNPFK